MKSKKIIVSFASTGRENYPKAQLRMIRSCVEAGWRGDYLIRTLDGWVDKYDGVKILQGSYPPTKKFGPCYNQAEVPYQFKPYIVQEAIEKGYSQIVWCDSTIKMMRNIQPLLDYAKKHGVCAFDNLGHPLHKYTTDLQQDRLGISTKELMKAKQIMACVIIFDISNRIGLEIFEDWIAASRDGVSYQNKYGSTRKEFIETRHDQSVISGLLHIYRVPILPYGGLRYFEHLESKEFQSPVYFVNKGVE